MGSFRLLGALIEEIENAAAALSDAAPRARDLRAHLAAVRGRAVKCMEAKMTTHAQRRAQQRAIPVMIDEWLDRFGDESYDGREQSSGILVMPASGKWSVRSAGYSCSTTPSGYAPIKSNESMTAGL